MFSSHLDYSFLEFKSWVIRRRLGVSMVYCYVDYVVKSRTNILIDTKKTNNTKKSKTLYSIILHTPARIDDLSRIGNGDRATGQSTMLFLA